MGSDVQKFEQNCHDRGLDFEARSALGGERVEVRFSGHFHQQPVIWQATIMTLEHYRQHASARGHRPGGLRQFIEVGNMEGPVQHIRIGLSTRVIDIPTILKTMIMVRQWKNLDYGIHEFGPD